MSLYTYDANLVPQRVTERATQHFTFHGDGGHSWLEVRKNVLEKYGILDKVSEYSYVKGQLYYLEEDCDAGLLIKALIEANVSFTIEEKQYNDCFVRGLPRVSR